MSKYYHIIQVDDAICQVQLPQGVLHEVLESHRSVAEPKGHTSKLVKPQIVHGESDVLLDPAAILTCQNLLLKSIVEKCAAPTILSSASWICSSG